MATFSECEAQAIKCSMNHPTRRYYINRVEGNEYAVGVISEFPYQEYWQNGEYFSDQSRFDFDYN